jgi:5'(3')-deoxyribonucleotidase
MKIVVDMDEVLCQFVNKVLCRWNSINSTGYTREDVDCWQLEKTFGYDRFGIPADVVIDVWLKEDGFFDDLEPMPGAIEGFNWLRERGHDVIVATAVVDGAMHAFDGKRAWMKKNFPDWDIKNFVACSRKGLIDGDILIDDGLHNVNDWITSSKFNREALIFDARWNRQYASDTRTFRVFDWSEIVEFFKTRDMIFDTMASVHHPAQFHIPGRLFK